MLNPSEDRHSFQLPDSQCGWDSRAVQIKQLSCKAEQSHQAGVRVSGISSWGQLFWGVGLPLEEKAWGVWGKRPERTGGAGVEVGVLAWFTQHHEVTILSPAKAPRTLVEKCPRLQVSEFYSCPSEQQVTRKRESWEWARRRSVSLGVRRYNQDPC